MHTHAHICKAAQGSTGIQLDKYSVDKSSEQLNHMSGCVHDVVRNGGNVFRLGSLTLPPFLLQHVSQLARLACFDVSFAGLCSRVITFVC